MFMIMRNGSRRRHEARVAREKTCIAAGCKCYCHVPREDMPMWQVALYLLAFGIVWVGFWVLMSKLEGK